MEPSRFTNRFDRFFRIEDARSEDMFGSQAQRSRPSALRCQRQMSRCFETGIESGGNRRTRLVAFGATIPDAMAGRTFRFAAAILSAYFYTDRLHRPRRSEGRRALRSSASPEIRGSPARHCDTLASHPSECRHVILLPRRAAVEIVPGSCQGAVLQTDTVGRPVRPSPLGGGVMGQPIL